MSDNYYKTLGEIVKLTHENTELREELVKMTDERDENKRMAWNRLLAMDDMKQRLSAAQVECVTLQKELSSLGTYNYQLNAQYERMCESYLAAEQRNVDQLAMLHMAKELISTISLHKTMAPADWCESFKNEVADRLEKLRVILANPTESGASE